MKAATQQGKFMENFYFADLTLNHVDDASAHYQYQDDRLSVESSAKRFTLSKQVFMLGSSFVSICFSESGWTYKTNHVIDGFLFTAPVKGHFEWDSLSGTQRLAPGQATVVNHRELSSALHSSHTHYTNAYISGEDMTTCMATIIGRLPKKEIIFADTGIGVMHANFVEKLIRLILDLPSGHNIHLGRLAASLKETLIGYIICNMPNNYTSELIDDNACAIPTPHSIKLAVEFMHDSTDPHLTVGQIAHHAGMSVRSLQLGFKRYKDTTPIIYLRTIRLEKAHAMFKNPVWTAKAIAARCGFSNYQIFCRYYLQRYGTHPSHISRG